MLLFQESRLIRLKMLKYSLIRDCSSAYVNSTTEFSSTATAYFRLNSYNYLMLKLYMIAKSSQNPDLATFARLSVNNLSSVQELLRNAASVLAVETFRSS